MEGIWPESRIATAVTDRIWRGAAGHHHGPPTSPRPRCARGARTISFGQCGLAHAPTERTSCQPRADDGQRAPGALAIRSIGTSRLSALTSRRPVPPRASRRRGGEGGGRRLTRPYESAEPPREAHI